ncbi:hypothetical protein, partial [Nocardia wallacei]|uniref:hypothetical protein n=1 Tax=Nocardia wallacei TaxID=480035 RepID=UPI003CC7D62B
MANIADGFGSSILGYPRIGPHRELKRALEAYWRGFCTTGECSALPSGSWRSGARPSVTCWHGWCWRVSSPPPG